MSKAELITLQAAFVARIEAMTAFLGTAMDSIAATNRELTSNEKAGFHYCIEALRHNARAVIETGTRLQAMEAGNG